MEQHKPTDEHCPSCGADIVYWLPSGMLVADCFTKIRAITSFPQAVDVDKPQHPGRYCAGGCGGEFFNFGNDELWAKLEADRKRRETASIIVESTTPHESPLANYKIYFDRNVRRTAPRDKAPRNSEYIELEPGEHTIVVRDYDHLAVARRESNTIYFSVSDAEQLRFLFTVVDGTLTIQKVG
ncbi:MAG: hypothetical protein KF851_16130 [Pirellulaceae bacterium]|nr:hypothetical protein [Pirellulaceae bacterium]